MSIVYSVAGCIKCKVIKAFLNDHQISFTERDIDGQGKEDFQKFYAANRRQIFRSPSGRVEFPVYTDGTQIRQGVGPVIAYLLSGTRLDDYFSVGTLRGEWVDGIHVSAGNPNDAEEFLAVLRIMKASSLKLQIDTDGRNDLTLQKALNEGLVDKLITL